MAYNQKSPVVIVVGTRPEGIKMMPVYFALKNANIPTILCSTMQHDQLLSEVFDIFNVKPDIDLGIMRLGQDLFYLTQAILQKTKHVFMTTSPSLVLVQGDTTSSMAAALSAFYLKIPVGHVEAGLRTGDMYAPFPEEMNRRFVSTIARYHFAPTPLAVDNLLQEGVDTTTVFCTGNTVVDALQTMQSMIELGAITIGTDIYNVVERCKQENKKIILLTAHRRESFGDEMLRMFVAIKQFLLQHPDVYCIFPYHPNPHVLTALQDSGLSTCTNIFTTEPVAYKNLVYLLQKVDLVLTDSGGIQEEAVSLGKPVLVLREKTERMEGVHAGLARLVGTDPLAILSALTEWHFQGATPETGISDVYGNGNASAVIVSVIQKMFAERGSSSEVLTLHPAVELPNKTKDLAMKKICVIGLGYIGLPTALVASEHGLDVIGVDIDAQRVQQINAGDPVIQEPEVFEKLQLALSSTHFRATTTPETADYFVIAVPTPFHEDKTADLSYVFSAAQALVPVLKQGDVVILESTIPVGTTRRVADMLAQQTGLVAGKDIFVAHCPERVLPGNIFHELVHNARIVGGIERACVEAAASLYKYFVSGQLYLTDATTAEMVKLVENSSRDVQIAFAQQVASMAYAAGLNPFEVIELANKHPRVKILNPSCGVGGHCIAVDPWFLIETFPAQTSLLKAAREVNDSKPREVIAAIKASVAGWQRSNSGRCTVLLLGLTYKADVDDMRESPALVIAKHMMQESGIDLLVCEPYVNKTKLESQLAEKAVSLTEGVNKADIIVYLVGHTRFKALDQKMLKTKKILDFCGLLHTPKNDSTTQELLFWPANSAHEFGATVRENFS